MYRITFKRRGYPDIEQIMDIIVEEGVKIVFTSAGNPKTWTNFLKEKGRRKESYFKCFLLLQKTMIRAPHPHGNCTNQHYQKFDHSLTVRNLLIYL